MACPPKRLCRLLLTSGPGSVFNTAVSLEGEPIANQLSSGRCWLFAMCNVVRIFTTRKFNLGKFELSQASRRTPFSHWRGASADGSPCAQSYLFFYDHLSKANWFLEQVLDLAGDKLDSRKMQFLFSELPAQDGGAHVCRDLTSP